MRVCTDQHGWQAALSLDFSIKSERTVLVKRSSYGPLVVQRPFHPEDGVCHVYVLHPPGGVVGGDQLTTTINVDNGARVLLTTPGASKLYRSTGRYSDQETRLNINAGSLEWFPQECIAFSGAYASNTTEVYLKADAQFIGWEVLCLGRPAANEIFTQGKVSMRFNIRRDNKPLLLEQLKIAGNDPLLTAPWGMRSFPCSATFIATGITRNLLEILRQDVKLEGEGLCGLTMLEDMLVCRVLTQQAEQAKTYFIQLWHRLREAVIGKAICEPRIWKT